MSNREYNGIVADLDIEEYHSSPGVSRSALVSFKRSPLHYWHEYLRAGTVRPESSEAMVFGNALHCLVLEPKEFHNRHYLFEKLERRSKAGKNYYDSYVTKAMNRQLISFEDYYKLEAMQKAIDNHPAAFKLIENAKYETSLYWTDAETGILCKCRPDIWATNYIADLKTTFDASADVFQREVFKYNYHLQAAMIHEGIKNVTGEYIDDFVFIAIEKEPPYAIGIYQLDKDALQQGVLDFHALLHGLKLCQESGQWPGYDMGIVGGR